MKKFAIFDIDGTIFRSSLLIELTEALIQKNIFSSRARDVYTKSYKNWLERSGSYEEYIGDVVKVFEKNIKGVKYDDFLKVAKSVTAFYQNRVYRYTRDLVKELRRKNYYLLAISNSPLEIVDEFCKKLGFNKVYGRVYEVTKAKVFTGKILYADLITDKSKILKRAIAKEDLVLRDSVGVGDTASDIPFLKIVDKPICFNPNQKLYEYAKRAGWNAVVERKDVVYHI